MSTKNFADICTATQKIRAGEWKISDLIGDCLAALQKNDSRINAMIYVNPHLEEEAADLEREATAGQWRGPLHGIPFLVKDNIDVCGMPTSMATDVLPSQIALADAGSVARLRAAGAVFVGKTNLDEFAAHCSGITSCKGFTRNPWRETCLSGGSSSGTAAGIAAGFALAGLGTDTGISIRLPSAWCGLCGLRPSQGQLSNTRLYPRAVGLDTVGPMARSVQDIALLYGILANHAGSPASLPPCNTPDQGWHVAVLPDSALEILKDDVREAYKETLNNWRSLPVKIAELELPLLQDPEMMEAFHAVRCFEFTRDLSGDMLNRPYAEKMHPVVFADYDRGLKTSLAEYQKALDFLAQCRSATMPLLAKHHALLLPAAFSTALDAQAPLTEIVKVRALLSFFCTINVPTLIIPGVPARNMPVGMQLVGAIHTEPQLFGVGMCYEKVFGPFPRIEAGR